MRKWLLFKRRLFAVRLADFEIWKASFFFKSLSKYLSVCLAVAAAYSYEF